MANPVAWFEVAGKDHQALTSFYSGVFGWNLVQGEDMPYSMLMGDDVPEGGIPGGVGAAPEGASGHVTFYVQVDDLEAALSKVEEKGGTRGMGPVPIPGGEIAHFQDPEGHLLGLMRLDG
jgi:uncharacterized protein